MRTFIKYLLLLAFITHKLYAQDYYKIKHTTDSFYVLRNLDSITIPKNLPDGKWKVFYSKDTSKVHYEFYLQNNNVNGPYKSYYFDGNLYAIGTYSKDNLWTFRNDKYLFPRDNKNRINDTTCKVGKWLFSFPYLGQNITEDYKIVYRDKDTMFTDIWYNNDNTIWSKRIYKKGLGLIYEINYNGNHKYQEYVRTANYSIETKWTEDDKIESVSIYQDSLMYVNQLKKPVRFYSRKGISIGKPFKTNELSGYMPIATITNERFDITDVDVNDNNFSFSYLKKNGKRKRKYIK